MMIYTDKMTIGKEKSAIQIIKLLRTAALATFAAVMLTGCVKDELHNTPHPDKGAVKVTTDWSGLSGEAVQPESYLLRIGETTHAVSETMNTFKELLPEGTHSLTVHNTPRGVAVGAKTATINTLADGTLEPQPEHLFSAVQELQVINDDTLRVNVKMVQAMRKLTLVLKLKTGDADRIASSTATLTGIAHTVDLRTGQPISPQTGKTVAPEFVKSTATPLRTAQIDILAAVLQLSGIVSGEKQLFKIVVTLTDGTTATIESDLTEALKNFGSGNIPLTLDAELPLPKPSEEVEGKFSGTITGWTEVDNGNITIH